MKVGCGGCRLVGFSPLQDGARAMRSRAPLAPYPITLSPGKQGDKQPLTLKSPHALILPSPLYTI